MAHINFQKKAAASQVVSAATGPLSAFNFDASGTTSIAGPNIWTTVNFGTKDFDENLEFDTAQNAFIPKSSGIYNLHGVIGVSGLAPGEEIQLRIRRSGTSNVAVSEVYRNESSGVQNLQAEIAGLVQTPSGVIFTLEASHNSALTKFIDTGFTFFEGWKISVGLTGDKGDKGDQGDQGPTGPSGNTGPSGGMGNDGIQGPPGNVVSGVFVIEDLTPQITGLNSTFSLASAATSGRISLFWNGIRQRLGQSNNYFLNDAVNGSGIVTCFTPYSNNDLVAEYFV